MSIDASLMIPATGDEIKAYMETAADTSATMAADALKYKGEGVPILSRTMTDATKLNNLLAHDFRGKITRMMVGYLFGKPVTYMLDRERYPSVDDPAYKRDNEELDFFCLRNEIADVDSETAKDGCNMGTAARLCYIDGEGQVSVMRVPAYECAFLNDSEAMRFYQVTVGESTRWYVEFYNDLTRTDYQEGEDGEYTIVAGPVPHLFDYCPLVEFPNNEERMGSWKTVESLIDAYDRTRSDAQNEHEEFRNAYLFGQGMVIDADTAIAARASGAFSSEEPDADLKFVTKNVNDAFVENHTKRLKDDIYTLADSVDTSDEKFSGAAQTGASRKWKLVGLENAASLKERKFSASTRRMFRVLCSAWQKRGYTLDWRSIKWTVDRNIPVELLEEAQVQQALLGAVTPETRMAVASFVTDPVREAQLLREQSEIDLDAFGGGDGQGDEDEGDESNQQGQE